MLPSCILYTEMKLNFSEMAPRFLNGPCDTYHSVFLNVSYLCIIFFVLVLDGSAISPDDRISLEGTGTLWIQSVKPDDSGVYTCDIDGVTSNGTSLTVIGNAFEYLIIIQSIDTYYKHS